jgi:hypothetical protein
VACSSGRDDDPTPSRGPSGPLAVDGGQGSPEVAAELLPDLRQEPPRGLVLTRAGRRYRLGFDSAATNVGGGPLVIVGRRPNRRTATMEATQIIPLEDGGTGRQRSVGVLRYVTSPDHSHWHLVPFMRYELRATDLERAARDRKTGFCLGDRYDAEISLPGKPRDRVYRSRCGLNNRRLVRLREGISVGYGDDYHANLEGQYLNITRVPAGRYYLIHRVNPDRRLRERTYVDNVSWLLVRIRWSGGAPTVVVRRRCDPGKRPSGCALTR